MSKLKVNDYSTGLKMIKKVDKCLTNINEILGIYLEDPDYFDHDVCTPVRCEYESAKRCIRAFKKWFREVEGDLT